MKHIGQGFIEFLELSVFKMSKTLRLAKYNGFFFIKKIKSLDWRKLDIDINYKNWMLRIENKTSIY